MTCCDVSLLIWQWLSIFAHFVPIAIFINIATYDPDNIFCNMASTFIILIIASALHFFVLLVSTIMYIVLKNKKSDKFVNYSLIISGITLLLDFCFCGILLFNYFGGLICVVSLALSVIIFTVYCSSSTLIFICMLCNFIRFHKCNRKPKVTEDVEELLSTNND
jgi:hypothetical protein